MKLHLADQIVRIGGSPAMITLHGVFGCPQVRD